MELFNENIILWDFDGVIMDSMPVRNQGFEFVLQDFPKSEVAKLMDFHLNNGGLSRYVKFRYFFEIIRGEEITDSEVSKWATKFSDVMKKNLIAPDLLIKDSLEFVMNNYLKYQMHIVSGSDGLELNYLCNEMGISKYFKSIHGSPVPKIDLVRDLIASQGYDNTDCILVGDSLNDLEAANESKIRFYGYNNPSLKEVCPDYIQSFRDLCGY